MHIAAIILTFLAVYAAFYSFCTVAADAEAHADRYRRRVLQARASTPPVWRLSMERVSPLGVVREH
ncbi:MAG: hypothetical protein ACXVZX_00050 [Terriglobales bacterium]